MHRFDIPTMTCGHCVRAITRAVQLVDAAAQVEADLAAHCISVASSASAASVSAAIAAAGYANTPRT